ncbi:xanthine phosphoribosyltransferase [Candidatus Formimonas warabiya]|uniref:Xanthine phosphoribosyltransferase n=1 Tax=Formimonas warabiya TaxID=1761012 RepID=A0A3G1KVL5_FORW1|nr:xanthine phosphoribosyltransferase [Candidatus Formimonas warabiya]ATW26265.1 xanthine phosphoribosyltransferase [Candidatus Formimonas warabiya]
MELLKQKILSEGKVISDEILKVDSFLNHQIDPILMQAIGEEFAKKFRSGNVTKVLTLEASGIAVAIMTALALKVPVVFAKKKMPSTMTTKAYFGRVHSFTKQEDVEIMVSSTYLDHHDRILIIDDFLATGEASRGMIEIIRQAEATLVGVGIVIEKAFQEGGQSLREDGIRVESLARIAKLENGQIYFD